MTYKDSHDKTLTDYPRPSVAVDTAVLTVRDGELSVAVIEAGKPHSAKRRLPGTFVHEGETLADAVRRSLKDKVGLEGLSPTQLHVFDAPGRDNRGWVMSVVHAVVVPDVALRDVTVIPVTDATGLAFDHDDIVKLAVARLRADYSKQPDPEGLLGEEFTLLELERLHRAIDPDGTPKRDAFRRKMEPLLVETGEFERGTVGKPARLFRRG
ncbi:NUDIX domain-containing protein [Diaminobutyricimonas sp. LJ205]|uniref:NrtR DNA-binding winged helix domain-containing protein n=1 Tax=Diaminobutyricimonas sp. LJ205 TaxID=2683590 RepID=UPI0012F4E4FE|nr:NUDIX domain-containing protein [Diaminobutyricimonas sp. LJ205]